jgi:hypothetical protein
MRIRSGIGLSVSLEEVVVEKRRRGMMEYVLHILKVEMAISNLLDDPHRQVLAGDLPSHHRGGVPLLLSTVPNPHDAT